MNRVIAFFLLLPGLSYASVICPEHKHQEESAFHWAENSFDLERYSDAMKHLQEAANNGGAINSCALHNNLAIVEGYILKLSAESALSAKNLSESIIKMEVMGFCEFLEKSGPCE